eukprot:COSAG01_NODE_3314_length_6276_cov_280.140845_8_plen_118_part_00
MLGGEFLQSGLNLRDNGQLPPTTRCRKLQTCHKLTASKFGRGNSTLRSGTNGANVRMAFRYTSERTSPLLLLAGRGDDTPWEPSFGALLCCAIRAAAAIHCLHNNTSKQIYDGQQLS